MLAFRQQTIEGNGWQWQCASFRYFFSILVLNECTMYVMFEPVDIKTE